MKTATLLVTFAMALATQAMQIDDHPVLYGRDALEQARSKIPAENTYSGYYQPRSDLVFVRDYDAKTNQPLFTAALHNDKRSLEEAESVQKNNKARRQTRQEARSLNTKSLPVIFARASRCGQYCSDSRDCSVSPNCRTCVHANVVKPPPAKNRHQKVCGSY